MTRPCIGLFGTCGKSTFRQDLFIPEYTKRGWENGLDFFNPQVADWKPEDAAVEAEHLATDKVVLFPVTGETYATGSLAEVGFSILNAIRFDDRRDLVVAIEPALDESLLADKVQSKESLRARTLVMQHLMKLRLGNLFVLETGTATKPRPRADYLKEMLDLSIILFENARRIAPYRTRCR